MIARFFLALVLACAGGATAAAPGVASEEQPFPGGAAAYMVEVQGRTLYAHEAERALPPASLTKIMTALLVLEDARSLDEVVTVSARAQRETGASLHLRAGERMRARDLLAATLLASANDACLALAEHVAGDTARFVVLMNRRARELGLKNTHFTNPCGHDARSHLASARDIGALTRIAMAQPVFADLVRTVELRVATAAGRSFRLENRNEMVGRYPGAIGVKSGFTSRAGKCLVALAERDGVSVLLVVLNAPNRWWDAADLLDRAFEQAPRPTSRIR